MKTFAKNYLLCQILLKTSRGLHENATRASRRRQDSAPEPLHPLEFTTRLWQRVYFDFASEAYNYRKLIYVDAHSKYPGAIPLTETTAHYTSNALLKVFSYFSIQEQFVLDICPLFTSSEFAEFCDRL